ncbi:MAG: hypothetical protein ACPF8Y_05950 [Flavobacteriales bacterium]|jgi:hypothetical protein
MKHILLLGALFLFGATASAQSCTGAADKKAKTECTKSKSSCCQGAKAAGCCDSKSKKGKKSKAKKNSGKEQGKQQLAMTRSEEKGEKKAAPSPAKN